MSCADELTRLVLLSPVKSHSVHEHSLLCSVISRTILPRSGKNSIQPLQAEQTYMNTLENIIISLSKYKIKLRPNYTCVWSWILSLLLSGLFPEPICLCVSVLLSSVGVFWKKKKKENWTTFILSLSNCGTFVTLICFCFEMPLISASSHWVRLADV